MNTSDHFGERLQNIKLAGWNMCAMPLVAIGTLKSRLTEDERFLLLATKFEGAAL